MDNIEDCLVVFLFCEVDVHFEGGFRSILSVVVRSKFGGGGKNFLAKCSESE